MQVDNKQLSGFFLWSQLLLMLPFQASAQSPAALLKPIMSPVDHAHCLSVGPKTVPFRQNTASPGVDAGAIAAITLKYFSSTDCSGASLGGSYTTSASSPTYPIALNVPFGLDPASAWGVARDKLNLTFATLASVRSMAVFLKSTTNNLPQANFSGSACGTNPSFCCVPVACDAENQVCSASTEIGDQYFTLKTTPDVGDPADGGVIGCLNTGVSPNLFDLIIPPADNSAGLEWSPSSFETGAGSDTDGATNTLAIVEPYGPSSTYAAGLCNAYTTTGGFTRGWYLPAQDQLNCIYANQASIGGVFASGNYWSSTERDSTTAVRQNFSDGVQNNDLKSNTYNVRCARSNTAYLASVVGDVYNGDGFFTYLGYAPNSAQFVHRVASDWPICRTVDETTAVDSVLPNSNVRLKRLGANVPGNCYAVCDASGNNCTNFVRAT